MESNSMILSEKIRSSMRNTLIVGGAGSGKTNSVIIPNLLQMMGSYVVHDVCGIMYQELTPVFLENGYEVHALNLHDTEKSDGYNPIEYVRNMEDALMIADYLVTKNKDTDVFFQEAEKRFIAVCILYAAYQESWNNHFSYIVKMLQNGMDRKDASLSESLIRAFAKVSDVSIAGELCTIIKQFSEKILAILVPFVCCKLEEIAGFFQTDAIKLQSLANGKNVIFLITGPKESPCDFLAPLLIEQSFKILVQHAGDTALSHPVRYMLDEFAQFEKIRYLECMTAVGGKYNIFFLVSVMTLEQIKILYPDCCRLLVDSFQNFVYMGSYDRETVEYVKQLLRPLGALDKLFIKETGKEKPKTKKEKQMFEYLAEKSLYGFKEDAIVVIERKIFAKDKKYKVTW